MLDGIKPVKRDHVLTNEHYEKFLKSREEVLAKKEIPRNFDAKVSLIASLAIKKGDLLGTDAEYFLNIFKLRNADLQRILKHNRSPEKARSALIRAVGNHELSCLLAGTNHWLDKIGRPDLKLTFDEVLDIILK